MDLNIDNYKNEELFNILDINIKSLQNNDLNYDFLYNKLQIKINNLKNIEIDEFSEISENKAQLVDFFYQCFIKINKLIQEKQKNNVIVQDNHNIIKHNENKKEEYYPVNYKSGILNPLTIKTFKKIININTRFRDNYESTFSSDFIINLPDTIKKVLTMEVINYQLPNTVYSVSSRLGSNTFYINNKLVMLTNGSYEPEDIVEEINYRLNDEIKCNVNIEYNSTNGKMTFISLDGKTFNLKFDYFENTDMYYNLANNINKNQLTLGWMLGFRGNSITKNGKNMVITYENSDCYEAESVYDNMGNNYFLLSLDDYQNNHNTTFISPFKYQSLTDNNILSKISSGCCNNKIIYPKRIYFGPTNINKLHIKIYDEFGRIIDINNADLSIELECEILYDL